MDSIHHICIGKALCWHYRALGIRIPLYADWGLIPSGCAGAEKRASKG